MSDCIDHGRAGNKDGYCQVRRNGRYHMKHRVVYCEATGTALSSIQHLIVRHTCDNPRCINPDHLLLGTHADNTADKVSRNRQPKLEQHGRAKLTGAQVIELRQLYVPRSKEYNATRLAELYGVSRTAVVKAISGENWHALTVSK